MTTARRYLTLSAVAVLTQILGVGTLAAQSGTLMKQSATVLQAGSYAIQFRVSGPLAGGDPTTMFLEFAADGNSTVPVADPFPTPSAVQFTLTLGASTSTMFTAANAQAGTATPTGIAGKTIRMDYANTGRYVLTITHGATIPVGTNEDWTLNISGLPNLRTIAGIEAGTFRVVPTGPCGSGGTTCPPCLKCRVCLRPCLGQIYYVEIPKFNVPPRPEPCPGGKCPPFQLGFDREQFDRVIVAFTPTDEQRAMIEKGKDVHFDVQGGERIGDPFESANGEIMQVVQYPKGRPPMVNVVSARSPLTQFKVDVPAQPGAGAPPNPTGTVTTDRSRSVMFGIGGLVLGALLGAGFGSRRRPGDTPPNAPRNPM